MCDQLMAHNLAKIVARDGLNEPYPSSQLFFINQLLYESKYDQYVINMKWVLG